MMRTLQKPVATSGSLGFRVSFCGMPRSTVRGREAMRLLHAQELVLAIGVGLGLARYRLTWPGRLETIGPLMWVNRFEIGIDSIFAGVGLVVGLATFVERALG